MASTLLQSISQDDYEKARFLSRRKYENDLESDRNMAIKLRLYEVAKNLLDVLDVETIAKKFELTIAEVEALKGDS